MLRKRVVEELQPSPMPIDFKRARGTRASRAQVRALQTNNSHAGSWECVIEPIWMGQGEA